MLKVDTSRKHVELVSGNGINAYCAPESVVSILWKAFEIWHSFQKYVGKKSLPEVWPPTVKTDTAFSNSSPRSTDQHPEERIYLLLEYNRKMKVCMLLNSTFGSISILCFKLSAVAQGQALT